MKDMKTLKEKFNEIFDYILDPFTIFMIVALFIGSLIVFALIGPTFIVALRDSAIITFSMFIFVVFGRYVKEFDKDNKN